MGKNSESFLRFWKQVWLVTISNMKSRYRKTFAGFIWVILSPLIIFGVQSVIFRTVLKINVSQYSLFLVSGLLPWLFLQQSMDMCTSMFVTNGRLLKSFTVHPLVLLFSQILDNLINFVAAFILVLVFIWNSHQGSALGLLLFPIPVFVLLLAVLGICWLLATVNVFLRDTRFVIGFLMSFAYFLTPVFYPPEFVPANVRWIVTYNPFQYLILPFRISVYDFTISTFTTAIIEAAVIALGVLALALILWHRKRNEVYLYI